MIGRDVVASGLGCDIAGALFLGWGLLRSPTLFASELMTDILAMEEMLPGRRVLSINTLKIQEFAKGMLYGRVGLLILSLGFLLQLLGLLVPSRQQDYLMPALVAVLCLLVCLWAGAKWVRCNYLALAEDIWRSPRLSATGSLSELLNLPREFSWQEPWFVRLLAKLLDG